MKEKDKKKPMLDEFLTMVHNWASKDLELEVKCEEMERRCNECGEPRSRISILHKINEGGFDMSRIDWAAFFNNANEYWLFLDAVKTEHRADLIKQVRCSKIQLRDDAAKFEIVSKRFEATTPPATQQQEAHLTKHFNSPYSKELLTDVFKFLYGSRYLHPDSVLDDWLWVCTGKGKEAPTKPLKLTGNNTLTSWAFLIPLIMGKRQWIIANHCFLYQNERGKWLHPKNQYLSKQEKNGLYPNIYFEISDLLSQNSTYKGKEK